MKKWNFSICQPREAGFDLSQVNAGWLGQKPPTFSLSENMRDL